MTIKKLLLWTLAGVLLAGAFFFPHAAHAAAEGAKLVGQPTNWDMNLQPPASPVKEQMEVFHHYLTILIFGISIFVMLLLLWVMIKYNHRANPVPSKFTHNTLLEVVWTVIPVAILVFMVIPSMKLLYFADRTHEADMTLNITGYQWYWGYEYPDHGGFSFMANLVPEKDLKPGQLRLLSTDNPVVLPVDTNIRLMITGAEVLHAFAMPAFGVKLDAVPGRHNETWVRIDKEGTFYGQCSELCGEGHGFMPIEIKAVSKEEFAAWVVKQGGKMPEPKPAEGAANANVPSALPTSDALKDGAAPVTPGQEPPPADSIKEETKAKAGKEPAKKKAGAN